MGSKGKNSTFSEHGHVAYEIKGNDECSNMYAHIMSLHAPSTPEVGSKVKKSFVSEISHDAYQINGSTMQAHVLSSRTPSTPGLGHKVKTFFYKKTSCCISNIRNWNTEHHASTYYVLTPILGPWGEVKRLQHLFSESSHAAYQSIGNEE